jgi:hypothetical protein
MDQNVSGSAKAAVPAPFLDFLYQDLLQRGIRYFFPDYRLEAVSQDRSEARGFFCRAEKDQIELQWLGVRYSLEHGGRITEQEIRLLRAIGRTIATRHDAMWNPTVAAQNVHLFRGLQEDHFVSAFLDPEPYASLEALNRLSDRITSAIEVLRLSALTTYENRRITTGALLFGRAADPRHSAPIAPPEAVSYEAGLTAAKSFHRLCDGLHTLALVDASGKLSELIDVAAWAEPYGCIRSPAPLPARYEAHCRATSAGGHICLVLTPAGEIRIFAEGAQAFRFSNGKWWLSDMEPKYRAWEQAVGDAKLAARLFQIALDMAEDRHGGLFIVLDEREAIHRILEPEGALDQETPAPQQRFDYLVRNKRLLDIEASLIKGLARIDGAVVVDSDGEVMAFGAIIRSSATPAAATVSAEGGRTTAAILASQFGKALKISEDGIVAFYRNGRRVWEL